MGDDFAVEDEGVGEVGGGVDEVGEFGGEVAEVSGVEGGVAGGVVELGADAVVFDF